MTSLRPLQWVGIAAGSILLLYVSYRYLDYFRDVYFLGGVVLLEIIAACIWNYSQRYLVLLVIAFVWAAIPLPLENAWAMGRWVVLGIGASVGFMLWTKSPLRSSGAFHLIAIFCICAAFVSATVSPFIQMASFKALSLCLLFVYCISGARLALIGREERFFRGLLLGSEITVFATSVCYLGLGISIWGNPNSLGAAMSVVLFPILLWGWFTTGIRVVKLRRLVALLLCTYLIRVSMARAGMVAAFFVTLALCACLRQYKLLMKSVALFLALVALTGVLSPGGLMTQLADMRDALLYKGHKEEGLLGSRRSPWDTTISSIKEHPWFGTGYGTSPTGQDPGLNYGTFRSSSETAREHGSSYMTITEWVGLLGVLPFVVLLALSVSNVYKVCAWMRRTGEPRHYSIPVAMVAMAGLIHAGFEDWLFAVGSYLCVLFWISAFLLVDLVPASASVSYASVIRPSCPSPIPLGTVVSNLPNR